MATILSKGGDEWCHMALGPFRFVMSPIQVMACCQKAFCFDFNISTLLVLESECSWKTKSILWLLTSFFYNCRTSAISSFDIDCTMTWTILVSRYDEKIQIYILLFLKEIYCVKIPLWALLKAWMEVASLSKLDYKLAPEWSPFMARQAKEHCTIKANCVWIRTQWITISRVLGITHLNLALKDTLFLFGVLLIFEDLAKS